MAHPRPCGDLGPRTGANRGRAVTRPAGGGAAGRTPAAAFGAGSASVHAHAGCASVALFPRGPSTTYSVLYTRPGTTAVVSSYALGAGRSSRSAATSAH
jgi:hypothetical protein